MRMCAQEIAVINKVNGEKDLAAHGETKKCNDTEVDQAKVDPKAFFYTASRIYPQRLTANGTPLAKEWFANVNLPFSLNANSIAVKVIAPVYQRNSYSAKGNPLLCLQKISPFPGRKCRTRPLIPAAAN